MRTAFLIAVVLLVLVALPGAAIFTADLLGYEAEINRVLEAQTGLSHHLAIGLPAALILFCVPPLIILLYFLRLRRKPIAVSSTFLWKKSIEDFHVNRLMQWLRRNILLLLQLLAVLMLLYAVLGPRLHGRLSSGKHYILIVDNSASMNATDVAPSRLAWAKEQALKEIDAARDGDSGMVIVFNSTAEILQSYTTNRNELRLAVRRIEPTQKPTRIDEALALAASLANPRKSTDNLAVAPTDAEPGQQRTYVQPEGIVAEVHLYSDGRFPEVKDFALEKLKLAYHTPPVASGEASNNTGIVRIEAVRGWQPLPRDDTVDARDRLPAFTKLDAGDLSKLTVTVSLKNYRDEAVGPFNVLLESPEAPRQKLSRTVTLKPRSEQGGFGRSVCFYLENVPPGAERTLQARLAALGDDAKPLPDDFADDDMAWLCLSEPRKAQVLVIGPENFILRNLFEIPAHKAISEVTWLPPVELTMENVHYRKACEGGYDLVIFDRCGPADEKSQPAANTLYIGHAPPPYSMSSGGRDVIKTNGPRVQGAKTRHRLMRSLGNLEEIGIDEAFRLPDEPEGSEKLLEAAQGHGLIVAIPRQTFTDVVMTFPLLTRDGLWNTNWPKETSFVLFVRNVLLHLGNVGDGGAEEPTQPGREKVLRPGSAKNLQVTRPDGSRKTFDRGNRPDFLYTETGMLGVYAAEWDGASRRFAVNLTPTADHDEGDLAPRESVTIGAQTVMAGEPRKQPRELWKWVVLAGLLVVLFEWWLYNRRVHI